MYDAFGRGRQGAANQGNPGLDDAALLPRDGGDPGSEKTLVVPGDGRNHANVRADHIGGVEPPSEPHLDHGNIHPFPGEVQKGHDGRELEERQAQGRLSRSIGDLPDQGDDRGPRDAPFADADSLGEIGQVR